jgi:hypothetical protein
MSIDSQIAHDLKNKCYGLADVTGGSDIRDFEIGVLNHIFGALATSQDTRSRVPQLTSASNEFST